jgi:hypothetical protein
MHSVLSAYRLLDGDGYTHSFVNRGLP